MLEGLARRGRAVTLSLEMFERDVQPALDAYLAGRLSEALTYAGAAALGFADPAFGTAKAAESRRLALQTGDTASIVIASWAQAAAGDAAIYRLVASTSAAVTLRRPWTRWTATSG